MKIKFLLSLLFIVCFCSANIQAQAKLTTIIDELEKSVPGEAIVRVSADSKIKELIGKFSQDLGENDKNYVTVDGFRILVFSSNDAKTAKKEVAEKGALIRENFPEIVTYHKYAAPLLQLFAGDFTNQREADAFKEKLQKTIPQLGKEMYVRRDKVNIPIQNNQ